MAGQGRPRVSRALDVYVRVRLLAPVVREIDALCAREGRSRAAGVAALVGLGLDRYRSMLRQNSAAVCLPEVTTTGHVASTYYLGFVSPEHVSDAEFAAREGIG